MKLMFFPVTIIEDLPHVLLVLNFSRKLNRYFLSAHEMQISKDGSQKTVCQIISTSDFLCGLLKQTTADESLIEQKLDFKHRCMFYSAGPTSDLCVCALDVDHDLSVVCNTFGYPDLSTIEEEHKTKARFHRRENVYQWICIRDIVDGLITCNRNLKYRNINDILIKMDLWLKSNTDRTKSQTTTSALLTDIKSFKRQTRQLIWDLMELKNEVYFPRPSHGRIPNFRSCEFAAENVTSLTCFKRARIVKINPSLAQEPLRYYTLTYNKILMAPSPALESVLFYKLDPKRIPRHQLEYAATKSGAAELGTAIQLTDLQQIHVDLVVVASVAVNPITGARIGKGKGYGDLEYGIMSQMGCVSAKTIVLTTCHESQLINDLPNEIMEEHDLPVDIIVTPKRYIYTKRLFPRPKRVYWEKIDADMFSKIPVLDELKRLEEQEIKKQ